ncbi:hypothetical protein FOCC_FOCC012813 [Frankliniella occidentalis]|nr:hypothetical protein FOCC_FOCC012813 [Frankliniella occidentalis]
MFPHIPLKINARAFIRAFNRQADRAVERQQNVDALLDLANRAPAISSDDDFNEGQQSGFSNASNPGVDNEHQNSDETNRASDGSDSELNNGVANDDEPNDSDQSNGSSGYSGDSENSDGEFGNIQFANDDEITLFLRNSLKQWALDEGILSMIKLNKLLFLLHRGFPNLLLDYRTLLGTPMNLPIENIDEDCKFWYKGIRSYLANLDLTEYIREHGSIEIDVNGDGLPLFKRSKNKFWVLLGKLAHTKNHPFIIAIFFGKNNPTVKELCTNFRDEVLDLEENGYEVNYVPVEFRIRRYICDAPARAKLKCIIEHDGYCGCERCDVEGEWIDNRMTYVNIDCMLRKGEWIDNRMTYVNIDCILRSDQSFYDRVNPEHHKGQSPLEKTLSWRPVSGVVLDVLHLVYIGVYKRLIGTIWQSWVGVWRLPARTSQNISTALVALRPSCPSYFNRPPGPLSDLPLLTAKEFRRSLLYEGVVVYRDYQNENVYKHFLLLHVAMTILSNPNSYIEKNEIANDAPG